MWTSNTTSAWSHYNTTTGFNEMFDISNRTHNMTVGADDPVDVFKIMMGGPLFFSRGERFVTIFSIIAFIAIGTIGNSALTWYVASDRRLHTPYLTCIACLAISDLCSVLAYLPACLYIAITEDVSVYNHQYYYISCAVERVLRVSPSLSECMSFAFLAVDRYLFFCQPYFYTRVMSCKVVIAITLTFMLIACTYQAIAVSVSNAYYSVTLLCCSAYGIPWYFPTTMVLFIGVPSLTVITVVIFLTFTVMKQKRQIRDAYVPRPAPEVAAVCAASARQENRTGDSANLPGTPSGDSMEETSATVDVDMSQKDATVVEKDTNKHVDTIQTAIKLVCCISLTFWLTYFPCVFILIAMFTEITVFDLEMGVSVKWHNLLRLFYTFGLAANHVVNPIFQFYFNRPLRVKLYKAFGIRIPQDWQTETTVA